MAVFRWLGGSVFLDQGRYDVASDWYDLTTGTTGVSIPQPGDTVNVAGVANAGIYKVGALFIFPVAGGYSLVLDFPPQPALTLQDNPNAIAGYTIQGQTLNVDGTLGVVGMWLENSQILGSTLNVTGTAVVSSYLDNTITGVINVGAAASAGFLQAELIPFDTAGVGPSDHYPVMTLDATMTITGGSEFDVEAATGGSTTGIINNGTITVAAGGTLVFDDTDNAQAATFTGGVTTVGSHSALLGNGGIISVQGAAGQTTKAVLLMDATGTGSIVIDGNGAARGATSLTADGYMTGQNVTLTDGTVTVNDSEFDVSSLADAGFAVTGGSFTFGDGNGTLVLHQAVLTTLQFNATDTGEVQTPDGRMPFTTPISGFGTGDVIALPGKDLAGFGLGETYVTSYDASTGVLQVQSPAGIAGNPPEVLAALTFNGSYDPALFHLTGNNATEELDLTYNGEPVTPPLFDVTDTATGASSGSGGTAYTGPVSYLQHQYVWSGPDGAAIAATVPGVFLHGGAGNDALSVSGGSNVLDGGLGSNFLVGGTGVDGGTDTFFLDGRAAGSTWSTVVNFHHGDAVTIFGFVAGVSTQPWTAVDGAAGYQGATIHSELAGAGTGVNASVTFAGVSLADALSKFSVTTGAVGGTPYLYVAYTG